jgi:hypothetical protein
MRTPARWRFCLGNGLPDAAMASRGKHGIYGRCRVSVAMASMEKHGIYGRCRVFAAMASTGKHGIYGRCRCARRWHLRGNMASTAGAGVRDDGIYGETWHLRQMPSVRDDGTYGETWHLCETPCVRDDGIYGKTWHLWEMRLFTAMASMEEDGIYELTYPFGRQSSAGPPCQRRTTLVSTPKKSSSRPTVWLMMSSTLLGLV